MLKVTVTSTSEMFSSSYTYRTNVPFYKCTVNLTFFLSFFFFPKMKINLQVMCKQTRLFECPRYIFYSWRLLFFFPFSPKTNRITNGKELGTEVFCLYSLKCRYIQIQSSLIQCSALDKYIQGFRNNWFKSTSSCLNFQLMSNQRGGEQTRWSTNWKYPVCSIY